MSSGKRKPKPTPSKEGSDLIKSGVRSPPVYARVLLILGRGSSGKSVIPRTVAEFMKKGSS